MFCRPSSGDTVSLRPTIVFSWLRHVVIGYVCLLLFMVTAAWADEAATLKITPNEGWSTVFGGKEAVWHFTVAAETAQSVQAGWSVTVNSRILARNETTISPAPGKTATVEVRVPIPSVKNGAILPGMIQLTLVGDDKDSPVKLEKPIWIYPEDPFADQMKWLESLKLCIFDPVGDTVKRLEAAHVPFTQVGNADALAEGEGLVLVGEGISFEEYRSLSETLWKTAAAGRPVLCLSPVEGTLALPGVDNAQGLQCISLQHAAIIKTLDKRLDDVTWPNGIVASTLQLKSEDDALIASFSKQPGGWPWLEVNFPAKNGTLLVCGFKLIAGWETSPTPRFLLDKLLEHLSPPDDTGTTQEGRTP